MSTPVTPNDFSEIRWRGHWIWTEPPTIPDGSFAGPAGGTDERAEAHGLFRKRFVLERVPERAPARITADSRYVLYVNGQEAFRGPVRSQPSRMHYDLFDLAPYLKAGENVIAVYVKYYGTAKSYWMPAVPNATLGKSGVLVFEAQVFAADRGEGGWLVSDGLWKAKESDAWSEPPAGGGPVGGGVPVELFDAGRFPYGWEQPGFDDAAWGNAELIPAMHIGGFAHTQPPTDPYGPLYPRPIARLDGETCVPAAIQVEYLQGPLDLSTDSPAKCVETSFTASVTGSEEVAGFPVRVTVPSGGAVRLVMDMGRIVSGFPQFEVAAPAGTVLDLAYVEDPITGPAPGFGRHLGTRYVARGANDRFQVFDSNGLRYVYVLVRGVSGPVIVKSLSVKENLYPWAEGAGFECSDEGLNRIFQAGVRTVQLNSHDAFLDCPTREQRAWVGDSVVHQMVHLATNVDWRLAWHYLTLANSPRSDGILPMSVGGDIEAGGGYTIPDWALHWVHGVYNLYRFGGDRERVMVFMPTVARILRWYAPFQNAQGLLKDLVEWNLVDWASISSEDTSGVITALWARGLREFAEMAAWLEEKGSQGWAEGLYARAKAGFEAFWDEGRGSYVDHIVDGVPQREMSQLGGGAGHRLWASATGALEPHRRHHHRSQEAGGPLVDGRRRRRLFAGEDTEADAGPVRDRLGRREPDRDCRALHELRGARRGGAGG
jgi:alpha-L-rhamnosidase